MIDSIEKYGGFYIGRYETGDLNKDCVVVRKQNINITNQNWYTMYKKCKDLNNENTNIETGMIWRNQYDRILMWLIESKNKTKEEICGNSTDWGNYKNAEFQYINNNGNMVTKSSNDSIMIPTGSSEYTKANNIYDLAGNILEWTMNAYYNNGRTYRGGLYYNTGVSNPASSNSYYSPFTTYGLRLPCNAIHQIA